MLGSDGNKMSKSLRNYPDVREVFDRDGADAMRWFLMSSPILRGGNLVVTEQGIRDSVRQVLMPLWSSWYFFQLYANAAHDGAGYVAQRSTTSSDPLDRYLLAKCRQYVEESTTAMDAYAVAEACEATRSFVDVLTNWYIRRSRDRFWRDDAAAFDTLYTVLETVCRVSAPLLPLASEEVWRGLTGERSVHLTDWPSADELPSDDGLVAAMDRVRAVCSAASALRKARKLRNRLPLSSLTVVVDDPALLSGFEAIVADEVNVKSVRLLAVDSPDAASFGVEQRLTVNARAAGPRLGRSVQDAITGRSPATGRSPPTASSPPAGSSSSRASTCSTRSPAPPTRTPPSACCPAAVSSSSTPGSRPSSSPRASRATWCAPSSRPAATPASTSPTGSRCRSAAPTPCSRRPAPTSRSSPRRRWRRRTR